MKSITTIILFFVFVSAKGQEAKFHNLLDSAKTLFKSVTNLNQEEFDKFDYYQIIDILNRAIKIEPNNAEARYFLGYAYSRFNSRDGRSMINVNLDLIYKSSEQFEKVIALKPKYDGDILLLDPYSKITAEWGSLAMSYWHKNKGDSAIWALKEGKKRGGFGDYILELNRKVLDACSQNSILISSGDNFTFPLWYLQIFQGFRRDIKVVDIGLLNTKWYPKYLLKNNIIEFDLPIKKIEKLEYTEWKDSTIKINNFSWILKPSCYYEYLLRGDRILLSLLKQNKFKKDVYFTCRFIEDARLCLNNYLTSFVIVDKINIYEKTIENFNEYYISITQLLELSKYLNTNSSDELEFFDYLRYNLLDKVIELLRRNELTNAKNLMKILDEYGNENKIPYQEESGKKYLEYIRQRI